MAFPIIVPIAMGISALYGIYKGGKGIVDNKEANELNESAHKIIERAIKNLDDARSICEKSLSVLGSTKMESITNTMGNFITVFEKLKNVELKSTPDLESLKIAEFSYQVLDEMKKEVSLLTSGGVGIAGGASAGAMMAFGAFKGTMLLGTAGTGTAISTLSGAAATNATLAWLGGGTLASGGAGIAGGTIVLGSIVAGPALAIAGWFIGNKAATNLNDAKSNKALAEKFWADAQTSITLTDGITEVAVRAFEIMSELRKTSRRATMALNKVIETYGVDYSSYNEASKTVVMKAVKSVQLLKALIDTPILNEKGELLGDTMSNINQLNQAVIELKN